MGDPYFDYQVLRRNAEWPVHALRTNVTAGMVAWMKADRVTDPACGDASILEAAHRLRPIQMGYLGDISRPNMENLEVSFPNRRYVQDAALTLEGTPHVDLVLLTEFLEHIPEPEAMVALARQRGDALIASSPLNETEENPEHLWTWDADAYQQMLMDAGWTITGGLVIGWTEFRFQIYSAR